MAVYKATYCYPFLGSCDLRVAPGETQWITCKVDSSNKKVTGYRISIYDEDNNLIFPNWGEKEADENRRKRDWNISPISELWFKGFLPKNTAGNLIIRKEDGGEIELPSQEYLTNSGLNGTYLSLPFFQNFSDRVTSSANAVYYKPKYRADYIIKDIEEGEEDYYSPENSVFWEYSEKNGGYRYNAKEGAGVINSQAGTFAKKLNGDSDVGAYDTILFIKSSNVAILGVLIYEEGIWKIEKERDFGSEPSYCLITKGNHHDEVYAIKRNASSQEYAVGKNEEPLWVDAAGEEIKFSVGKMYKWEITLYQGDGEAKQYGTSQGKYSLIDYSNMDVAEWYDMVLQSGQILGSCPSRIQIAKYDDKTAEYLLPKNKDGSSVLLYQTYAQLLGEEGNDLGARFYVNTYSSSLGHVYPLESDTGSISVDSAKWVEFYKHSNNSESILDTDIVDMASVETKEYIPGGEPGDVELCGLQNIDGVVGENGKYVLLMYQKKPAENGVYKMVDDSDNTITVKIPVTITNNKGETSKTTQKKIYKRDSSGDKYDDNGVPESFAWTHEMTEEETKAGEDFLLTVHTKKRYCVKDQDKTLESGTTDSSKYSAWRETSASFVPKMAFADVNMGYEEELDTSKTNDENQCWIFSSSTTSEEWERDKTKDIYDPGNESVKYACYVYPNGGGEHLKVGYKYATPSEKDQYPKDNVVVKCDSSGKLDWDDMYHITDDDDLYPPYYNAETKESEETASETGNFPITSAKMATWTRAGGYTEWSNYIGKIIFVQNGEVNGNRNFSSTATAGGTLLKKPYGAQTTEGTSSDGSSPLYFVPERAVVLFPQLLNDDYSIKALGAFETKNDADYVDGVILSLGDYYINENDGAVYKYSSKGDPGEKVKEPGQDYSYYYVNQGEKNGLGVCRIGKSGSVLDLIKDSKDLCRAEVLKNTTTSTYIGAYSGLDLGMAIKFDDKVVQYKGGSESFNYLKFDKVNRVVWKVDHEELKTPFRSYSNNTKEPYHYKICSFYKKSDENPFYFREDPYLIINKRLDDGYTDENDYLTLFAYPTNDSGSLDEEAAEYSLFYSGNLFNGTWREAFEKLSFVDLLVGEEQNFSDGVTLIKDYSVDFVFPKRKTDKTGTPVWSMDPANGAETLSCGFEKSTLSNAEKGAEMIQKIESVYGDAQKMALGNGETGLKTLKMPECIIKAAAKLYTNEASKDQTVYHVLNLSTDSTSGYKLPLSGLYRQWNGGSWESYRWVLEKVKFDDFYTAEELSSLIEAGSPDPLEHIAETRVIKDTGIKYDKNMSVLFYGLLDSAEEDGEESETPGTKEVSYSSNIYLITLYVVDENGRDVKERKLLQYVTPSRDFTYCIEGFGAKANCEGERVDLTVYPKFIKQNGAPSEDSEYDYLRSFSIFRREYKRFFRYDERGKKQKKTFIGDKWSPVIIDIKVKDKDEIVRISDFNIKNGHSYQYVIFPGNYSAQASKIPYIYANTEKYEEVDKFYEPSRLIEKDKEKHWRDYYGYLSKPVKINFQYWSLTNLISTSENSSMSSDYDEYIADPENIWLFKYQVESGSLSQNLAKNEYNTLGQYAKVGIGRKNYLSGSISCYIGSEIIPLLGSGYTERTPSSKISPMSTNEKAYMVGEWRKFVATGTPKLLRDIKGQSWIVQIMDNTTTTNEVTATLPDTVSFSWKQIASADDAIIYSMNEDESFGDKCSNEWEEDTDYE